MYTINRKSTIFWKRNPSTFEKINNEIIGLDIQRLGSAMKPVNTMLSLGEELRMIMPVILATTPESTSSNWDELVAKYWHSLCIEIMSGGLELEIGFNFSIDDDKRKKYIDTLIADKKISTDKGLAEYVMGNINGKPNILETDKWKYGAPISPDQYLWWRYALINREVANTVLDLNKSPMIRFYLHSDEEQKEIKKKQLDISKRAIEMYNNIIVSDTSIKKINQLLHYLMQDQLVVLNRMDDDEKQIKIIEFVKDKPQEFCTAALDKSLPLKVEILKYIDSGIFRKVAGTNLIVDGADSSVIIGDGMDDAVAFIKNDKNKEIIEQYRSKLKSLTV